MRIRTLGCSGGIGGDLRTTCLLLDDDILIDAGTGLGDMDLEAMAAVRHIFVTHAHLDHIAGIPLMADSVFGDLPQPVQVHALPETIGALREHIFNWVIWPDFTELPVPGAPVLSYAPMRAGESMELGGRHIEMVPVNHVVPAVCYVVRSAGGVFAFSGDSTTNDSFWERLNQLERLDVLVVESAFCDADVELCSKARHYCPSLLAQDLKKLRHRPEIYLTHLKPGVEARIFAECQARIEGFNLHRLRGGDLIEL